MLKQEQFRQKIVLKRDTNMLGIGIGACVLSLAGVQAIIGVLPFEEGYSFMDVFGLIFLCFWTALVLCGAFYCLFTAYKQITLTQEGIFCATWFGKTYLPWSEVKDWGLSYCGQTKGQGNTYHLYFSDHQCSVKNDCKKKLKGKMIKTYLYGDDYYQATRTIIPFGGELTPVKPFIGKDKYHFM